MIDLDERDEEEAREVANLFENTARMKLGERIRLLCGFPTSCSNGGELAYAESGGLDNLYMRPNLNYVVPVFPWSEQELKKHVGDMNELRALVDEGRLFPVVQLPSYYKGMKHLEWLFEGGTRIPSYFIRSSYVQAAVLGRDVAEVRKEKDGNWYLTDVFQLTQRCPIEWLNAAKRDDKCWEYRYRAARAEDRRDGNFWERVDVNLRYRYASVALFAGEEATNWVIENCGDYRTASTILLHLHVFFDHVLTQAACCDFVVRPETNGGGDFMAAKQQVTLGGLKEEIVLDNMPYNLPREKGVLELVEDLCPLGSFDFETALRDMETTGEDLKNRIAVYNRDVQRHERSGSGARGIARGTIRLSAIVSDVLPETAAVAVGLWDVWGSVRKFLLERRRKKLLGLYILSISSKK